MHYYDSPSKQLSGDVAGVCIVMILTAILGATGIQLAESGEVAYQLLSVCFFASAGAGLIVLFCAAHDLHLYFAEKRRERQLGNIREGNTSQRVSA